MNHLLSSIVLPPPDFSNQQELFVREFQALMDFGNGLEKAIEYRFDTWMNLFAAKKYYTYCDLGRIFCHVEIDGPCIVKISGYNRNIAFGITTDTIMTQSLTAGTHDVPLPDVSQYEGVFFSLFSPLEAPVKLIAGGWYTDADKKRDEKLAVITCTYKREDYITKNIQTYKDFIVRNPSYAERMHFFVIDNGKTLDKSLSDDNVSIFYNLNAGGAGGFGRGLFEISRKDAPRRYGRILFIDDDVEVFPEAFIRTLLITNYLKDEYQDSFINGAMLSLYHKNMLFENIALRDGLWVRGFRQNYDVNRLDEVLRANDIPEYLFGNDRQKAHSAWFFCCFTMKTFEKSGFPLPIFIRGDDVEYSWRNFPVVHISMNGIGIWHAPFEWRDNTVRDFYFLPRNMFFNNMVWTPGYSQEWKAQFYGLYDFGRRTFNYHGLELLLEAMRAILNFRKTMEERPDELLKRVNDIGREPTYAEANDEVIIPSVFPPEPGGKLSRRIFLFKRKIRMFLSRHITKHNLVVPDFLCRGICYERSFCPDVERFTLKREARIYNFLTSKYVIRRHDAVLERKYRKEFNQLLTEIEKKYDSLHEEFIAMHHEFTTREFWKKYLKMEDD